MIQFRREPVCETKDLDCCKGAIYVDKIHHIKSEIHNKTCRMAMMLIASGRENVLKDSETLIIFCTNIENKNIMSSNS